MASQKQKSLAQKPSMARAALLAGLILVLVSSYPAAVLVLEEVAARYADRLYEVHRLDSLTAVFSGHTIILIDEFDPKRFQADDVIASVVQTLVDDVDYSVPNRVEIRPFHTDANRYWHWIALATLRKTGDGTSHLIAVQRIDTRLGQPRSNSQLLASYRFRVLHIGPKGEVREEFFDFEQRSKPLYRKLLVDLVMPTPIGFWQENLGSWPGLLYPLSYPLVTLLLGLILGGAGFYRLWRDR